MQQVLSACLAVVGLAFTGANAGFAADMAVPPLIAPVAALMVVLKRCRELCLAAAYALALTGVVGAADLGVKAPIVPPVPVFSWTGVYLESAAVLAGGTKSTVGIRTRRWLRSGRKWEALDPCRRLARPKDRSRSAAGFSEANLEEIGRSSRAVFRNPGRRSLG